MMKLVILSLVLSSAAFATPKPVACGTHEKNIAEYEAQAAKLGNSTIDDGVRAQLQYLKAEAACGTITPAQYCQEASKEANALIDSTQDQVNSGAGLSVQVDKAIVEMTAAIAPCSL